MFVGQSISEILVCKCLLDYAFNAGLKFVFAYLNECASHGSRMSIRKHARAYTNVCCLVAENASKHNEHSCTRGGGSQLCLFEIHIYFDG